MSAWQREIAEESSAHLRGAPRLYSVYSDPGRITAYPDGNVSQIITFAFVGHLTSSTTVTSPESRELRFFDLPSLGRLRIAPTHAAFAEHLCTRGPEGPGVYLD